MLADHVGSFELNYYDRYNLFDNIGIPLKGTHSLGIPESPIF